MWSLDGGGGGRVPPYRRPVPARLPVLRTLPMELELRELAGERTSEREHNHQCHKGVISLKGGGGFKFFIFYSYSKDPWEKLLKSDFLKDSRQLVNKWFITDFLVSAHLQSRLLHRVWFEIDSRQLVNKWFFFAVYYWFFKTLLSAHLQSRRQSVQVWAFRCH